MALDILNIQPHEVSRDLCGYTVFLYGAPKTGKTTIASQFDDALLLAFEVGYLAIPGIKAQPISRWSEFKQVLKQLNTDAAKQTYKNIIVDTADICYDLCEKFICNQHDVEAIGDLGFGKGYRLAEKEFDEALRSIPQMGYGLVLISHAQDKTFKDESGLEYDKIVPTLANKPRLVTSRMSDIIGYAHPIQDENGDTHTTLYMRGMPRFEAGSRFKYTPDSIEFTYENLVNAIGDAIDKQAAELSGKFVTDKRTTAHDAKPELNFDELMAKFNRIVSMLRENAEDFDQTWGPKIKEITSKHLGPGKKMRDATSNQVEQVLLVVDDLEEAVGQGI